MSLRDITSTARNVAHDLVALVGAAAGSAGAIASGLDAFGLHVGSPDVAHFLLAAGSIVALISKAIDSANNAATTIPTARPLTTDERQSEAATAPFTPKA